MAQVGDSVSVAGKKIGNFKIVITDPSGADTVVDLQGIVLVDSSGSEIDLATLIGTQAQILDVLTDIKSLLAIIADDDTDDIPDYKGEKL